ncbi:uncharacterized protein LOC120709835 [Panicum virgatum]|uniref:uncharacterized protein LOC120709835 n=1 Tax=Panicum virgatum TaxID=38727 RepID=UPI0019D5E575|nr:uncharacterized protein LOC120709835 [Panicum virgatum]
MDRSWIYNSALFLPAFLSGVLQFMEYVRGRYSADEKIKCPCQKCLNQIEKSLDDVHKDIELNGMSRWYTRWVHHGEEQDDVGQDEDGELAIVPEDMSLDGNDQATLDEEGQLEDVVDDGARGVQGLIQDLRDAASHGFGGNLYKQLMEEAKRELYPGCTEETRLSFIIKLLHIKVYNRITTSGFDAFLELLSSSLKNVPGLPKSYNEMKALLRKIGFGYVCIYVCKYDCALFWKDHEGDDHCPVCGFTRWKVNKEGRKKVPHKVLRYFPIIPRLQRFFMSKQWAQYARWHKEKRVPIENEMRHPADGEAWKDFDETFKSFADDPRSLRLGIATDGFNPFGQMSNSYSIWPVIVVPYNFPPWMCMDQSNYMLALLIPSKKSPGKDFHVFMQPLIAYLIELWKGVKTYDAVEGKDFSLRAAILWGIHDYPALGTMSARTTKGYFACVHCDENPCSECLRNKIGFIDHRRFLPNDHAWRTNKSFNGKHEKREKPRKFSADEVMERLDEVCYVPGKNPDNKPKSRKRRRNEDEPVWHLKVSLYDLPYWSKLKLQYNLDVMHIEKNICENILSTLLNIPNKTKDTIAARLDLEDRGIRKELHLLDDSGSSSSKPRACYVLKPEDKKKFLQFVSNIKFPDGYASNISRCVNMEGGGSIHGLKTHGCHIMLQRILPAGLRGLVRKDVYEVITELGTFFRQLSSKTLKVDALNQMKEDIVLILCKLEKIYPPAFFDVMVHLAVHLPDEALLRGPVQYGWVYPIERRLGTFKRFVRNQARLEGSIAEAYTAYECMTQCSTYFSDIISRFTRPERNLDGEENISPNGYSIFGHGINLLGASKLHYQDKDYDSMIWFVLNNCEEVDEYKE